MSTTASWTPNRVHQLRRLIEARFSASQAANKLGCDKSTAIRRAQALGLHFESLKPGSAKTIPPMLSAPNAAEIAAWRRRCAARPPIPLPADLRTVATEGPHKTLTEAGDHECRWPMTPAAEPGSAATPLCCAPADRGPYCTAHRALALAVA